MDENDFEQGAVKRDPSTGYLAQRTMFDGEKAWRVFRADGPPHFVAHQDIAHWNDLVAQGD